MIGRLGLIVMLLLCGIPLSLGAQSTESRARCSAEHWSTPRLLEEQKEDAFVVTSAFIGSDDHGNIFIVGRGPEEAKSVRFPIVAYKVSTQGEVTRLSTPTHEGDFLNPRLAVTRDTIRMFWGETASTATIPPRTTPSIWTASYVAGGAWSEPRSLGTPLPSMWWQELRYSIRRGGDGSLQVPVLGFTGKGMAVRWIGVDGSPAIPDLEGRPLDPVKRIPHEGFFYPWIAYPGPSEIVLGYVSPLDDYGVAVIRTSDNGQTWSKPLIVEREDSRDVRLVKTPDKRLHLFWAVTKEQSGFSGKKIGYATSSDGGASWSEPVYPVVSEKDIFDPVVVADRNGALHLVYHESAGLGGRGFIYYTNLYPGADWSEPVALFDKAIHATNIDLMVTNVGEVVMHFIDYLYERGGAWPQVSAISRLRPGKDCK